MSQDHTYISPGDAIDLYYKLKQKGYSELWSKFQLSDKARTVSKWNQLNTSSDFWIIPEVRKRWNQKCTGDPELEYEDYVVSKYLTQSHNLLMLSVGCGSGAKERNFGKYSNFEWIEGIDIASKQLDEARQMARDLNFSHLNYIAGDFLTHSFADRKYDVILFNSSLHHFNHIEDVLRNKIMPLLKDDGYLIIFEYAGPRRLQWTNQQLKFANKLMQELPDKYKKRSGSNSIKHKIYRPGLLRMLLVDPSEAIDSESILPSLHKLFTIVEEKKIGWDITQLLFKDIAHNFLDQEKETQSLLNYVFDQEDRYLAATGRSDAIFGIYQKLK